MKTNATVGLMSICACVLLATLTSVYAFHTFHGGGIYFIEPLGIFAEFQLNPDSVHSKAAQDDDSTSFQMVAFSTTVGEFSITDPPGPDRMVTMTGEMRSITVLRTGPNPQTFAETVPFRIVGVDGVPPGAGNEGHDFFSLTLCYSAGGGQGQLFADLFGECDPPTEPCDPTTCPITFAGRVVAGDLFIHTTGGE
jgi:hypothetical protein